MKRTTLNLAWCAIVAVSVAAVAPFASALAGAQPVSPEEQAAWVNHLIPLPHEIAIKGKVTVAPKDVAIRLRGNATSAEKQAVKDLNALFQEKAGVAPSGSKFEILIGAVDADGNLEGVAVADVARLKELPYSDQAYLIRPEGEKRLIIAGLSERGAFYGVQTLRQLLEAGLTKGAVEIPMAVVTDWPDFRERGFWNFPLPLLPQNAALKINFATLHSGTARIKRGEPVVASYPMWPLEDGTKIPLLDWARLYAVTPYLKLQHLNYWTKRDLYKAYPELAGKGDKAYPAGNPHATYRNPLLPCATNPLMKQVITEAMRSLAEKGCPEVAPWLSECPTAQCQCEECLKIGQLQAETNACVAAWQEVRKDYPDFRLRIFFSMGNDNSENTQKCIAALPPEVIIEKVYGEQKPYLDAAAAGRIVISYSGQPLGRICVVGLRRYADKFRVKALYGVKNKLASVLGCNYFYSRQAPAYSVRMHSYSMNAIAEWSWNANGRSVRDFAVAWATRQGISDPQKFADWAELIDPVHSMLMHRHRPNHYFHYFWARYLKQGKAGSFFNGKQIADGLAAYDKALPIAKELNSPELIAETEFLGELLRTNGKLFALSSAVAAGVKSEEGRKNVEAALAEYKAATQKMATALNPLIDICTVEPVSFAERMKKEQADGWLKADKDISAAIAELLK